MFGAVVAGVDVWGFGEGGGAVGADAGGGGEGGRKAEGAVVGGRGVVVSMAVLLEVCDFGV